MSKNANQMPAQPLTPREQAQQKYNSARANLIIMLGFTVINVVLAFLGSESMLLFSATVPYLAAISATLEELQPMLIPLVAVIVVSIAAYLAFWIFSKKHYGFMIAALVFFIVDTLVLVGFYILLGEVSGILDVAIHAWVLYYLVIGVINGAKLRKLPPEETGEEKTEATLNGVPFTSEATGEIDK